MSGGVRNVTFRNIFYNSNASCVNADPRDCGGPKPGFYPGGAHFKTQRGRGGFIEDILYDNIHGSGSAAAISFSCLHGAGPVANKSATPVLRNISVRNMHLVNVHGDGFGSKVTLESEPGVSASASSGRALSCAYIDTLEETPIDGLFLENITIEGNCGQSFRCESLLKTDVGPGTHMKLFATGNATGVRINRDTGIAKPNRCAFLNDAPAPSPSPAKCTVTKNLGCFNVSAAQVLTLPMPALHDHVTLEGCASACHAAKMAVAGIEGANHCSCGSPGSLSSASATALSRPMEECVVPSCVPKYRSQCACSGNLTERCGDAGRLLAFSFQCAGEEDGDALRAQ